MSRASETVLLRNLAEVRAQPPPARGVGAKWTTDKACLMRCSYQWRRSRHIRRYAIGLASTAPSGGRASQTWLRGFDRAEAVLAMLVQVTRAPTGHGGVRTAHRGMERALSPGFARIIQEDCNAEPDTQTHLR